MADGFGPGVAFLYHSQEDWDAWGEAMARMKRGDGTTRDARLIDRRVQEDIVWASQDGFQFKVMETLGRHGLTREDVPDIMGRVCDTLDFDAAQP